MDIYYVAECKNPIKKKAHGLQNLKMCVGPMLHKVI